MKKIFIVLLGLNFLTACSDTKQKTNASSDTKDESAHKTNDESAGKTNDESADKTVKEWLQQKEWKSDAGAPITQMKLFADGRCVYSTGTDTWSYRDGSLGLHLGGSSRPTVKWPVKKIDDKSFSLYVEPTQKTFTYTFVGNL